MNNYVYKLIILSHKSTLHLMDKFKKENKFLSETKHFRRNVHGSVIFSPFLRPLLIFYAAKLSRQIRRTIGYRVSHTHTLTHTLTHTHTQSHTHTHAHTYTFSHSHISLIFCDVRKEGGGGIKSCDIKLFFQATIFDWK